MGAVDLVIQVESPTSVARGLQRVGRAGHQVGAPSKGSSSQVPRRPARGRGRRRSGCTPARSRRRPLPRNPLDVLAQQIVAMAVMDRWTVDEIADLAGRAAPFEHLAREALEGVLAMLAGRLSVRRVRRAQAAGHLGPPDRRHRGPPRRARRRRDERRHDPGSRPVRRVPGRRAGHARPAGRRARRGDGLRDPRRRGHHPRRVELADRRDRARPGHGHARARASPASCRSGTATRSAGRSSSAGRSARSCARSKATWRAATGAGGRPGRLGERSRPRCARRREPRRLPRGRARGGRRPADGPADRRRALPRRARRLAACASDAVRRPRPRAVGAGPRGPPRRADGGRGPDDLDRRRDRGPPARRATSPGSTTLLFPDPEEIEDLVVAQVANSALFASRFRENAARALLLPRRRPGRARRSGSSASAPPTCWPSPAATARSRSSSRRTASASRTSSTCRRCARSSAAWPAARSPSTPSRRRARRRSPSLLFDYVAAYMYEGDAPLAERRAQALTLDRDLLRELLGQEELRELLDPAALADLELALQALADDRQATTADQLHDLLRRVGDLSGDEVAARVPRAPDRVAEEWLRELREPRAVRVGIAGSTRWIAIEDVGALPRRRRGAAAGGRAGCVPRANRGRPRRPARALGPHPRPVPRTGPGPPLGPAAGSSTTPWSGCWRTARCSAASSGPAAPSASGATPRSCASCGAGRWPGCGARSSRSTRRPSRGSCRPGRAWRRPGRSCRRSAARRRWSAWPRSWTSSRACRSRPPSWSATCCRPASPATSRACSTSSGRWARWPGRAAARSAATTAGSSCSGPAARSCASRRWWEAGCRAAGGPAPRRDPRTARPARRHLLPRDLRRGRRRVGPRGARRALGPRLGRRGHERHLRAAAGAALAAPVA